VGEVVPVLIPRASPGHKDLALRFNDEMDLGSRLAATSAPRDTVSGSGLRGFRNRIVHRASRVPPRRVGTADPYGICLKHDLSLLYLELFPGMSSLVIG
jgi:hypothetical protein